MTITLLDIRRDVNEHLTNFLGHGTFSVASSVSGQTIYKLPNGHIVNLTITDDGSAVSSNDYILDADSGYVTFDTAPTAASALVFTYTFKMFDADMVLDAINDGLHYLFPHFYQVKSDTTNTGSSSTLEYNCPSDCEVVIGVDVLDGSTYMKQKYWEQQAGPTVPIVRFHKAPAVGTMRIRYVARPSTMAEETEYTITSLTQANPTVVTVGANVPTSTTVVLEGTNSVPCADGTYTATNVDATKFSVPFNVSGTAGTTGTCTLAEALLADCGVPERSSRAVALYATYVLLSEKIPERLALQSASAKQGQLASTIQDIRYSAQWFKVAADAECTKKRMLPWKIDY